KGPKNPFRNDDSILKIPLKIFLKSKDELTVEVGNQTIALKKGEFTEWIRLKFNTSFGIKLRCICKFFLKSVEPYFELYITPLNIDPEKPALPVSHPFIYSSYLSKILGDYSTLGISDDTWALNERVIDEDAFLKLAYDNHSDKEKIFFNSLNKIKKGLIVNVFDISDTVQHMFFRYIGKKRNPEDIIEFEKYQNEIEKVYVKLDSIVEKVINQINDRTVLIIVSDHGFKSFRKGVNINSWLFANGYLHLKNGVKNSEKYFRNVDWAKTKAYALGLGGLYINQKGRESQGIVTRLDEKEKLKKEITEKLLDLKDEETGEKVIKNIYDADEVYRGPYKNEAPDLLIGYSEGYRASWDSVIGKITDKIIEVNEKSWSGDHCIDPEIVPGVFFCNRKINTDNPEIIDIAPTVLNLFGITPPHYMDGKNLI
ncbi:nucleotide pyrophosphatase, partial [candidate division KSB1 bacterium]